jgi:methylase of polypeptide subunit release factors
LNRSIKAIKALKFETLQNDVLGKIFHRLIPNDLRKRLAAYYTSNDAAKLITALTLFDDKCLVLDPACGSGTLLVSAYQRKKQLNPARSHQSLLSEIYGCDVSTFAAQLVSINLALQEPLHHTEQCQIAITDIFEVNTTDSATSQETKHESGFTIPKVDLLLGNPPFTRGDRLSPEYKHILEAHLKQQNIDIKLDKKHLGLHAYFLLDAQRFLKDNGTLAVILPAATLYVSSMRPILSQILQDYNFTFLIASESDIAFSEDAMFEEIILIAKRNGKLRSHSENTKVVTFKHPLSQFDIEKIAQKLLELEEPIEREDFRLSIIPQEEFGSSNNWLEFFKPLPFQKTLEPLKKVGSSINNFGIQTAAALVEDPRYDVDAGARAGIADFYFLPNKYWEVITETKKDVVIRGTELVDAKQEAELRIPRSSLTKTFVKASKYHSISPEIFDYGFTPQPVQKPSLPVQAYIRWGEETFDARIPRSFPYVLTNHKERKRKMARVIIPEKIRLNTSAIMAYYFEEPVFLNNNSNFIRTENPRKDKVIAAYLNSSLFLLVYLSIRRPRSNAFGELKGVDFRFSPIINVHNMSDEIAKEICAAFDEFIRISDQLPVFRDQVQAAMIDPKHPRRKLDELFCSYLRLDQRHLTSLYEIVEAEIPE